MIAAHWCPRRVLKHRSARIRPALPIASIEHVNHLPFVVLLQNVIVIVALLCERLDDRKLDFLGPEALVELLSAPDLFVFDVGLPLVIHLPELYAVRVLAKQQLSLDVQLAIWALVQ